MTTPGKRNAVQGNMAFISVLRCASWTALDADRSCLPSHSLPRLGFLEGTDTRTANRAASRRGEPPARFPSGPWFKSQSSQTQDAFMVTAERAVTFLSSSIEGLLTSSAKVSVLIVGEVSCLPPILAQFQRHNSLG